MSAKCSRCGLPIFVEGQCYGTQLPGGWICDDDCKLGLSLKPDTSKNELTESRDPASIANLIIPPSTFAWLVINEKFKVQCDEMPSWWHRFWYRALLGWRWEEA